MTQAEEIQIVWDRREAEARRIRTLRRATLIAAIAAALALLAVALTTIQWR